MDASAHRIAPSLSNAQPSELPFGARQLPTALPFAPWPLALLPCALLLGALLQQGCRAEPIADKDASDAAATGGLGHDPWAGEASGVSARYDLAGKGWHDTPFPSELRRRDDGGLDLSGFPEPRKGAPDPLLASYLTHGEAVLDGWGVAPTAYIAFDGALQKGALPTPTASMGPDSQLLLVDVDAASPERGRRYPLRSAQSGFERGNLLHPHLLMVQAAWGAVLRPDTSYALIVRRGLRDSLDRPLAQPEALAAALDAAFGLGPVPTDPLQARLAQTLAPLAATVDAGKLTLLPRDIAAVAVFRTGRPALELAKLAKWLDAWPGFQNATKWALHKEKPGYRLYTAEYVAPNFQHGTPPYLSGGGGFAFLPDGTPDPARLDEPIRVAVAVPKLTPGTGLDVGGLHPVVIYSHGTGGDYFSFIDDSPNNTAELLTDRGMVVISIDQPLHGKRAGKAMAKDSLYLASFNFLNPPAGRAVFRQAALDNVALIEMIQRGLLDIPASATGSKPLQLDANRLCFYGHSQGGLVGPLLASVEHNLRAFVLSGTGAGLSLTVVRRKDIVDFPGLVTAKLGLDEGELSELHPAISLIQLLVEPVDPIAYARQVLERPAGIRPPHILHTEGLLDEATPAVASEALAVAMGLHLLEPVVQRNEAMVALATPSVVAPVFNNVEIGGEKVTAVLRQVAKGTHYVIFDVEPLARLAADFLAQVASTGDALIETNGL